MTEDPTAPAAVAGTSSAAEGSSALGVEASGPGGPTAGESGEVLVRLRGVSKRYGEDVALQPLDLDLVRSRTTVLIGPSGCGKSTTLRLLIGLIEPDDGYVEVAGQRVERQTVRELRQRMGYVIQEGGLFPHLTAAENIGLQSRYLGGSRATIRIRMEELTDLVKLDRGLLDRYPTELSGGQRQRVGLVRALMLDPDVLLLDEPLGALDPLIRADLQQELRAIIRRLGKATLLVTHDIAEAAYFGDEIVLMERGAVVQKGTLSDLVDRPATPFVTAFLNAQRSPLASMDPADRQASTARTRRADLEDAANPT